MTPLDEKGIGLVVPGFLPTSAGDSVEYAPSWIELLGSLGIWTMGAFLFTVMAKVALAIRAGLLRHPSVPAVGDEVYLGGPVGASGTGGACGGK